MAGGHHRWCGKGLTERNGRKVVIHRCQAGFDADAILAAVTEKLRLGTAMLIRVRPGRAI